MKVLLSAYACEPNKGSEPAVGWQWVLQIARVHDVWVMTRANNREGIEASLREHQMPTVRWIYVDLPRWARFWKDGEAGMRLYYYLWQFLAYRAARKYHRRIRFDITHHVTFGMYRVPSLLWLLRVPLVFGPVGGGESTPFAFWRTYNLQGKLLDSIRSLAQWTAHADPFLRLMVARAAVTIAATEETARRLRQLGAKHVLVHPQWAMPESDFASLRSSRFGDGKTLRVLAIARLVHWKGVHLTIRAFAEFHPRHPASELWIVSDGPERGRLERLARELGVGDAVVFWGRLTLSDTYRKLREGDILVHPALHEAFGLVCLEAMAAGKPVICLDIGGPALQVTENTGFKIPARNLNQAVHGIAEALSALAGSARLRQDMGRAAVSRVRDEFQWDRKGDWMASVYSTVVAGSCITPLSVTEPVTPQVNGTARTVRSDL